MQKILITLMFFSFSAVADKSQFINSQLNQNSTAQAGCKQSRCQTQVGYILLPQQHYQHRASQTTQLGGKEYKVDTSQLLLREEGIPELNTLVTINASKADVYGTFDWEKDLKAIKQSLRDWHPVSFDRDIKVIHPFPLTSSNPLIKGDVIKVINYKLLKEVLPSVSENHLLMLVETYR